MPEGPECHIIAAKLNFVCRGTKITRVSIPNTDYIPNSCLIKEGATILAVAAYGRKIIFQLSDDVYFIVSQFCSGRWEFRSQKKFWILLQLQIPNSTSIELSFRDDDSLSSFMVCDKPVLKHKLRNIGPDLITSDIEVDYLQQALRSNPQRSICTFLLSQNFFSGIGNYLKCEILYMSKISPKRTCGSLSEQEIAVLHYFMHLCIRISYATGGMPPFEQKKLDYYGTYIPVIYQRDYTFTGYPVIRETIAGRATYYCEQEQF